MKLSEAIRETNKQIAKALRDTAKHSGALYRLCLGVGLLLWLFAPLVLVAVTNSLFHYIAPQDISGLIVLLIQIVWFIYWGLVIDKAYSPFDRIMNWVHNP